MELTVIDCVTLTQVPESQSEIIANLMQLYKYDFSEFAAVGSRYGEVGPDGRYTYEGLDSYWREDGRVPLTVQADRWLAGFILVNRWSALNRQLDHSVAECLVMSTREGYSSPISRAKPEYGLGMSLYCEVNTLANMPVA
jgi:predicted acetyltransferase